MLDFLCALVTVLAAAAFAQFGVTLDTKASAQPTASSNPEVRRTVEGGDQARSPLPGQGPGMKPGAPVVRLPSPGVPTVGRKGGG